MAKKAKKFNEEQELEQSYRKKAGRFEKAKPVKAKKRGNGLVIAICILIPILLLGAAACYFLMPEMGTFRDNGLILENVTIAGVNVGGLSKEDAIAKVNQAMAEALMKEAITVTVMDQEIVLTPEVTEIKLDVNAAVEAAYAFGRTGSSVQKKEEKLLATTSGLTTDITSYLSINRDAVAAQLDALEIAETSELVQTVWEVTGEAPDLNAAEAPAELQTLVITMGTPGYSFNKEQLINQILKAYVDGTTAIVCDCQQTLPDPIDLDAVYAEYCVEAADAQMDPETFEVSSHTFGHAFDLEAAKEAVDKAKYGEVLEFPFTITAPKILAADLSGTLFRDVLSTYTSYQASSSNRATNMQIACKAINGTILLPGDVFDFNKVVGERTAAKGYKPAPSYSGAETILTYGGGVCQPSSTIYYCALLADMEIVDRACHTYVAAYLPYGMDATVNWGTLTFKFRNSSDYPIRIDASADSKGNVKITLMGTDTKDYYVKMEYEFIGSSEPEEKIISMTMKEAEAKGYKDGQVITSPVWGSKVQTYRCKYSKADDKLISRTKEDISVYSKRDKEVVHITDLPTEAPTEEPTEAPTTPTTPPATEPPATEPPATEPPATDPPATDPPATDPPATDPPATDPPATDPPATDPPATSDSGSGE